MRTRDQAPSHRRLPRRGHCAVHRPVGHRGGRRRLPRRQPDHPRGVRQHSRAAEGRLLHDHPRAAGVRGRPVRPPGQELAAGPARQPPHHGAQRQAPHGRLPGRRLHAHPVARAERRGDALPHLLRLPDSAGRDHHPGGQPSAPRRAQIPARRRLPGLLRCGRRRRGDVRGRGGVGHRAPLRPAAVAALPHPQQDPAPSTRSSAPSCWPSA